MTKVKKYAAKKLKTVNQKLEKRQSDWNAVQK